MGQRWGIDAVTAGLASTSIILNAWALMQNAARLPSGPVLYSLLAGIQLAVTVLMMWVLSRATARLRDAWRAHQMDVRVLRGGQVLSARLHHVGPQDDGQDVWVIIDPPVIVPGDEVRAGMLPPRTTVVWVGVDDR